MPTYDYRCRDCGDFAALRPMSRRDDPCACPSCGSFAERALVAAPSLAGMPAASRRAHAINERSAHAPKESGRGHGAGCGCCSGAGKVKLAGAPAGAPKGNPNGRPWMISH